MKRSIFACVSTLVFSFAALAATTTKTVTWELPANWDAEVAYPEVQGYRAIVGPELLSRTDIGKIADPDLPYYRIRVAIPSNATFGQATCDVDWEKVDLGDKLPIPIAQPVPTSSEVIYPAPGPAYETVYPSENVKTEYLQIMNDVRMMPITVTPFRWDGTTRTLYKAKKLKVTATYTVPATRLRLSTSSASSAKTTLTDFQKMALSMTINPEDGVPGATGGLKLSTSSVRQNLAYFGNDNEADYVIISPHEFIDLWKAFAEFRKTTENGKDHTFCVTDARTIYEKYDTVDGDDALKIHRYIEDLYAISPRKIKYVLLGAAAKKYQYDRETMIPARYIVCSGSLCQMLDMYYGCMDRMPVGVGVEVWDYDGDGAYLGHKNANGSYSQDSNAYIDWQQDLAVFRFPLMKEVVESKIRLTAEQIMTNFINKVTYLESEDYPDRYSAIYTGSTGFSTSTYGSVGRGEMYGLITDEREFFDQGLNIFSPEHPSWASDSEYVPRDHGWEFLTYMRGNRKVLMNNSSYNTCSYADIYKTSGEFLDTVCHGWARGAVGAVGAGEVFTSTGYYTIFDCAVPCDTGMYDYCPGGSYGITNCICVGEAPALAPKGGGLASINNTRYGWSATGATSYNNGNGNHSFRLSWLFLRALTGVKSWAESKTYQPMNAGEALMWAHNMHGTPYATAAWGLSGAEVTGQGDPLARLSVQYERTWNPEGDSHDWSTNAANWSVTGKDGRRVFDVSRNVYLPLTDEESETFSVSNTFTTAGFFVEQGAGKTLTLKGEGSFKSLRETVITNGNVRWEVAGGAGRNGIKFVGARGNIELPGNAKRYFGECFSNVGTISVSGGNVVIDTPRNFNYGKSGLNISDKIDWSEIEFVAANKADVTAYNQLRSRTPGIFKTDPEKHLRVVNSLLSLQTYNIGGTGSGNKDKPLLFATNSTIKVQANPLWKEEYFVRPTYLDNSTIIGDYDKFAFGPADGTTGYDLYVSGKCAISGDKPIKLNGTLRIHFVGEGAELEIANAMCDGTKPGTITFDGAGKVKISATQTFTSPLVIPSGVTLEGAIAKLSTGAITIENGATADFSLIPLQGVQTLTLASGARVNLPGQTANGIYQVVDSAVTTLVNHGAMFYDVSTTPATQIEGDISEGYLLKTADVLFWKGESGTWNKSSTTVWTNATGEATKYSDGVPLCFADGSANSITITVGEAVAPGFMDFRNHTSSYVFTGVNAISLNSLAIGTGVTFDAPLKLANTLKVTGGRTEVTNIETPSVEVANGGTLRVKGVMTVPTQKIKKLKVSFAATKDSGNVAAIQELRLFNKNGFFSLPKDTVITDIAGQKVTITGTSGDYGHTMTGNVGDESLSALVDGTLGGNNKWWPHSSKAPTWFEITFPEEVDAITGYDFYTADTAGRNPKAWSVYTAANGMEYTLTATKSDVVDGTAHHWMIGDGTESGALYPLINVNGFAEVKAGGTLVLDGELYANVSLEAGAKLAIEEKNCLTNKSPLATLTLPESGTVTINLARATSSNDPFPILVGYNLTNEQLDKFVCSTEEGMLVIRNGDLYAATQSEKPPYRATVTTSGNWSTLAWQDADGKSFTWNTANRRPNGEVQLTINGASTISVDVDGKIGRLVIMGSAKGTFVKTGEGDFTPAAIDDSVHTGTLDWQLPTGSASVTAGSDTCIRSGAEGKGLLTVNANKKVTLGTGVTFANRAIDEKGWVRFEGTRSNFELAGYDPANYSFTNGLLTGSFTLDRHTIKSRANDYVKLIGSEANYYARSLFNFDIEGGTVEIETNGDNTWFGRTGTPSNEGGAATLFNQSGGTFRCLARGTGAGGGLLTGYEGGTDAGNAFYLNLKGGNFEVPNSYLNFGNPTIVTLLGNAHMKAKGYIASMSPGTIELGSNSTSSVVMEVGSLGLNSGAANITMYKNSAIVGFEDGAYIEGGITLRGKTRNTTDDTMTIAAANGTTLTLRNLIFSFYVQDGATSSYNGKETVVFGNSANGWGGTIEVVSESCLPVYWNVASGTVDLGSLRYASGSTLKAQPNGIVTFTLSDEEYESGVAIDLIHCETWANGKTSDQLKSYFKVYLADGTEAAGTLSAANGTVTYIPVGGASEYVYPLTATVDGSKNWTALTWTDRNGKAYSGNWENVMSAQLINNGGNYTVTMNQTVSLRALNTQVAANKTLTINDSGDNHLLVDTRFNDSTSAGKTVPNIALGAGVKIYAGKDLQLTGSMDESTSHGTLVIGSSNKATVNNGYWNGAVEMADLTAQLYFYSTTAFDRAPCALNPRSMGKVTYNATIDCAGQEVNFGSDSSRAADGRFIVAGPMTCSDLFVGRGNNSIVGFDVNGGSLTMAKDSHDGQWVLGQDAGSQVTTWVYPGATISASDTTLWLGKGGSAKLHLGADMAIKGIVNDASNATSSELLIYGKTLTLGAGGINIASTASESFYASGTIRLTTDASISVTPAIGKSDLTFDVPSGVTLTVNSPMVRSTRDYLGSPLEISGGGTIVLNARCSFGSDINLNAGTLKLATYGLLNNCPVAFKGGHVVVELTLAQVRAKVGNTYTLYKTAATVETAQANTTVIVKETGNTVNGIWAKKSDNSITFTPADGGDITATIGADGDYAWTALPWRDRNGAFDPSGWQGVVGNVLLTNAYESTVTIADTISMATLRLYNDGKLTINGPFTADTVDDSRSTGTTIIGNGGTLTAVKAGKDTILNSSGSGTLTIESGKKATSKVAYGGTISNLGTYVYDYPVTSIGSFVDDRRYVAGGTSGGATYSSGTVRLEKGTYTYSGNFSMLTASAIISGDTKVITPRFVLGDGGSGNSNFRQTGGTFEVTGSTAPTSNQSTILLGHWNSDVTMTIAGGTFVATNAATRLGWDGRPTVTVGGGSDVAVMRVKGIQSGNNNHNGTATFNLQNNGVLELGDYGLQASGSAASYNFTGGKVIAFANSSVVSATIDKISIANQVVFAAEDGKTLTVNADFAGDGTIVCGESGKEGTVLFLNGKYADSSITGTFAIRLTAAQQSAGTEAILCKTPDVTDVTKVMVQLTDGSTAPGAVAKKDGNLVWAPPACKMPLVATATGNVNWSDLTWKDSSDPAIDIPKSYWPLLTNITYVVTVVDDAVLTMPNGTQKVSDDLLTVCGTGTIVVDNLWPTYKGLTDSTKWQGTLRVKNKTGCAGLNFVYLGNSASTVEVDNVSGYFAQESVTDANPYGVIYPYTLKVVGTGLTINNGSSYKGFAFENVTGDGPINFGNSGGDPRIRLVLKNVAAYTGTLTVLGKGGVTLGSPTARIDDGTIVFYDGCVASGKTWTAPNGVTVIGKLTMTPNAVKPFNCALTFNSGSTLNVAQNESDCESVPLTTGTLTMDLTKTTLTFNNAAKKGEWTVVAGSLAKTIEIAATTEGFVLGTGHNDKIIKASGLAGGYFTVGSSLHPVSFTTVGSEPVVLKFADSGNLSLEGGLTATEAKVVLDASAVNGYAMATNAVHGAPYSHWLVRGAYSGTVEVTLPTKVPVGYQVTADKVPGIGIRLVMTAPSEAKFGVLSLNLHNGTALSVTGDHGLYPDVLANWGNLQATANANTTVSNATFTVGNNASGYNINTYTDEIYHRYLDDSQGVTRTIAIGNIPFEKYRVIVYYSTDTANYQFQPLIVNDGTGDVYYAGATQLQNVKSYTVKGHNASWGHSGPDKNMNAINEGVNLLVTDVYTVKSLTLKFKRSGDPRATPCAIQIVKVGDIVVPTLPVEPFTLTIAEAKGTVDWAKANWIALNEIAVPEETWASPVGEARIVAEDGGSVTLNAPSTLSVASLGISGGTLAAPIAIDDTANAFASTQFTIAEEGVLKLKSSDNRTYKVSGAGAASSTLIVTGTKGWGFNAGASIRNVTLIADSSSYQTWLENRNPAVFDETVDVVSTNGSPITVGGGLVTIGSLAGDGNLSVNGAGTLTINMLRAPTTYSGVCAVPLTVNGTHPLTLTGANTCALTVNSGATVNLSDGGKVGSASGSGTINVNAGTLSAALGSALNMNFAENTTLNITATLTQGGSFPITTGTMTGSPAYTLNGAALPGYCRIENGNLIVTPEQRAWTNPVTGDAQNFTFRFAGTSDASWTTIGNWRQYGTISWNTITGTAPMLSSSSRWDPTVIDGALIADPSRKTITLSGTNMEGWNPRLALFGGVNVTIGNMTKLQGDAGAKWIWVDETSKLTFTQIASGNFNNDFKMYVASPEGVTFTQAIPKDGTAFEYYLGTNGSVKYDAALTKCSHALKRFGVALRAESCGRAVNARNLVTFPSSSTKDFTTTDATAVIGSGSGTKLDRMPTDADEIGSYYLTKESTALKVYFVDYATNILTVASGETIRASEINAKATGTTDKLYVVFENGATIKMDAELTTEGVSYDFSAMTDGIILDCSEKNYEPNEYWRGFFFERKSTFTGVITISAGTLTLPFGSYINSITIAAGATLNLTGTLTGEEVTITTGTFTNSGNVTVNGQPIPGDWEIKDGKIVKIHWKYPVIYTIAASETSFTTKTATWKDSSNPQRTYAGGFDGQVDAMTLDGVYAQADAVEWVNDATSLTTTNLAFSLVYNFALTVRNADGCSINADLINGSLTGYNYNSIHLMFDTGAAKLIPGANMVLYGSGSGPVELTPYMGMNPTLTFNPDDGNDITYSGAITGTGKVIMDGEGSVALTGVNTFSGGLTVSNGVLSVVAATGLGTSVVTVESDATLKLPFGDYANNLSFTEGAKLDLTGTFPESGTYTITAGELSGTPTVTINGEELGSGYQLEGKVITRVAPPSIIPIAVWDGDFKTLVKAGWTLSANGNTVAADGSTITIASNQKGVLLTRSAGTAAPSVIVEYEDLSLPTGANTGYVLATSYAKDSSGADTHQDRTGLAAKGISGTATAVWNGEYNTTDGSGQSVPTSGRFGFVYKAGTSTSLFSATETLYSSTSLKAGADTAVKGFAIGGMRNTATTTASDFTYGPAAGMVIKRIAVFDTEITQEDVANFRWNAHTQTATWPTYRMFDENPNVFTWKGSGAFHSGAYESFSIYSAADTGISFNGSETSEFPGLIGTKITPWFAFSKDKNYTAPGCVLRISPSTGKQSMDAQYSGLAFGGMIVESGATGYSFSSDNGNNRDTYLGDSRGANGVDTWFVFSESFTFSRGSTGSSEANTAFKLRGKINFDIASGKTVTINKVQTNSKPALDTTSTAWLKMHGEGQIVVNSLTATGNVTLDYTDLANRQSADPYISGTLKLDGSTKIRLPANATSPYKLATALDASETAARRTIYIGDEEVLATVTFSKANGTMSFVINYVVDVNDGGTFVVPDAIDTSKHTVKLIYEDGTEAADQVIDGQTITYTFAYTGKVCWWDYEFDGNGNNTGTEGTALSWDNPRPFQGNEYVDNALRIPARPWRNVSSWPEVATFVMYGKMVKDNNRYQIVFGSSGYSNYNTIFLATKDVAKEEVVLCRANGNSAGYGKRTVEELCTMTVPNAQTANHLYAFTLKAVDGNAVVDIYLDGQLLESKNLGEPMTLGPGFQIASPHGGPVDGYARPADDDPATLDFLRVYKCELTAETMAAYAEQFPYVSPNGSYTRIVTEEEVTWKTDDDEWIEQKTGEEASLTNAPAANATVELDTLTDTTVTMALDKDVTYEAMTIDGTGEVTIRKSEDAEGQVKITGRLTVNTDATIDPNAIDVANTPITIAAGKTLTINMTKVSLDEILQTTSIPLTGAATTGFGARVDITTGTFEEIEGRSLNVEPNADQRYEVKVEVVPEEVKLGMAIDEGEVEFAGTKQIDIPLDWALQLTNTTALTHGEVTKTTVATALNATDTIPNKIKPWESYVLGLSPTNQFSKPVTLPVQTADAGKLTLKLGNVTVRDAVKDQISVTYKVITSETVGGEGSETTVQDPSAAVLDLPASGVKYYRFNVQIAPK